MSSIHSWDYLAVTASNARQAQAYEERLGARRELGLLASVRETLVVPDIQGKRIGSGGSTLLCLIEILRLERARRPIAPTPEAIVEALRGLRILIVHAGGDSRRLPAYGPCGKIFVPLPGMAGFPLPPALFDRLIPDFLALPQGASGAGQIVVAAGDALIRFDPANVRFDQPGLTALGVPAAPEDASRHGVFWMAKDGTVSRYLQKPSIEVQRTAGVIDASGRTPLDIGVMSMDAAAGAALLLAFGVACGGDSLLDFTAEARRRMLAHGIDLYREICCGLGADASLEHYIDTARASGSGWSAEALAQIFPALHGIPFHAELVPECRFLHFGSTRQLIESGLALMEEDGGAQNSTVLRVNSLVEGAGAVTGTESWIEGCRISAPLKLTGRNVAAGVDIGGPLTLPSGACLEVLKGLTRANKGTWFVRCYGIGDTFKDSLLDGARFCGRPLMQWLASAKIDPEEIWPGVGDPVRRSLWNARVFPAVSSASDYRKWLWIYAPESAREEDLRAFREADRYSAAEIAVLADQPAFHERRTEIWKSLAAETCKTR